MSDRIRDDDVTIAFSVPAVHRLRFTDDVFGADHAVLHDLLEPSGPQPARVQIWLDDDVDQANPWLREGIDRAMAPILHRAVRVGNFQVVPGGESSKNDIHLLERMLKVMNAADLDRRSYVAVIGGGAVLDVVGFAASIAHRGIRLVRFPTTTLAQADSGVGVKNGVNLFDKKNWVGSFAIPWGVINDTRLLETLSDRDYRCGFAEAVKVSLLKDPAVWQMILRSTAGIGRRDPELCQTIIRASAKLHLQHITQGGDPFESEEARPLDFGHWSAHKLESLSHYRLRHGEAVATGLAIDVLYSSKKLGLPIDDAREIISCLVKLGFSFQIPELADVETLMGGLEEFRQHLGGRLTLTMLRAIGSPVDVHEVDTQAMKDSIRQVYQLVKSPSLKDVLA
ncbi:3-dehydroquinate synthase [bacterium]|nr:3-dehydroquinate synthase [bacterium]